MAVSSGWPAPAKINLFLHVVGRRDDGYHLLQTAFQFVDRCDWLSFDVNDSGRVRRARELAGVPEDDDLIVRAARALQRAGGASGGVTIDLDKQLPMGGGLGGGSSDAATVLVALNALWQLGLDTDALADIGLSLGADVPVFVHGAAAWAEGVGERLEPVEFEQSPTVIVTPKLAVNTGLVFAADDLTRDTPTIKMHAFSPHRSRNDCEPVTRRLYPEVGRALDWLSQFAPARMSGTGASVFASFDAMTRAEEVVAAAPDEWDAFCAPTVNRSPLLDRLASFHA